MIKITQTQDSGYTVYGFEANNTSYEILTQDGKQFDVYSKRIGLAGRAKLAIYDSLEKLALRSKALSNFAALVAA